MACTDIAVGVPKITSYSSQVRSMRPDIIATDEIFGEKETQCILDCIRCGVKVIATLHSDELIKVKRSPIYSRLPTVFLLLQLRRAPLSRPAPKRYTPCPKASLSYISIESFFRIPAWAVRLQQKACRRLYYL